MSEPVSHTNRKGKTYYAHAVQTKKGKVRYVMKRTAEGALTELPEGFAITEGVHGTVAIGRPVPSLITAEEEAIVRRAVEALDTVGCVFDCRGGVITVYEPHPSRQEALSSCARIMGIMGPALAERLLAGWNPWYDPVMRFTLCDPESRQFTVARQFYTGDGGWLPLSGGGTLQKMVDEYLPHIGKESFYELI